MAPTSSSSEGNASLAICRIISAGMSEMLLVNELAAASLASDPSSSVPSLVASREARVRSST